MKQAKWIWMRIWLDILSKCVSFNLLDRKTQFVKWEYEFEDNKWKKTEKRISQKNNKEEQKKVQCAVGSSDYSNVRGTGCFLNKAAHLLKVDISVIFSYHHQWVFLDNFWIKKKKLAIPLFKLRIFTYTNIHFKTIFRKNQRNWM